MEEHEFKIGDLVTWKAKHPDGRTADEYIRLYGEGPFTVAKIKNLEHLYVKIGPGLPLNRFKPARITMRTRTYTCTKGGRHAFWEITVNGTHITRRFGTIGAQYQESSNSYKTAVEAEKFAEGVIKKKLKKGYVLKKDSDTVVQTKQPKKETPLKLTRVNFWKDVEPKLLSGEKMVYSIVDQNKLTLPRRRALVAGQKAILNEKSEGAKKVRETVWKLLRLANLTYLLKVGTLKPDVKEAVRATIAELIQEIESISPAIKSLVNSKFEGVFGPMKPESAIKKIEADLKLTTQALIKEIEAEENISVGGISRKRSRKIARLLKKEKKNENKKRPS